MERAFLCRFVDKVGGIAPRTRSPAPLAPKVEGCSPHSSVERELASPVGSSERSLLPTPQGRARGRPTIESAEGAPRFFSVTRLRDNGDAPFGRSFIGAELSLGATSSCCNHEPPHQRFAFRSPDASAYARWPTAALTARAQMTAATSFARSTKINGATPAANAAAGLIAATAISCAQPHT